MKIIIITILEQQLLHASSPATFAPSMAATNGIIAFSTKKVLYILFLGGCCQRMIRGLHLKPDSKSTVTEVLNRVIYDDIQSLQNLDIANIYLACHSPCKLKKDIEFYALLHFTILKARESKQKEKKFLSSLISIDIFAETKFLYETMVNILNESQNRFEENKLFVTREDCLRLQDGNWLNDAIINAFGKLLNDHCNDKIFFFGTYFLNLEEDSAKKFLRKHHRKCTQQTNNAVAKGCGIRELASEIIFVSFVKISMAMKRAFHKKNIVEYPYLGMYDSFVTIMCNIHSCKIPKTKNVFTIANTFDDVQNIEGLNTPPFNRPWTTKFQRFPQNSEGHLEENIGFFP